MLCSRLMDRKINYLTFLLIWSVLLSGTQTVVLCMASETHVAIEVAGHHHCDNEHEYGSTPHKSSGDSDDHDSPCRPCVDVPLSPGITENSSLHNAPLPSPLFVGISTSNPGMDDIDREIYTRTGMNPSLISFYTPLSSIILIV